MTTIIVATEIAAPVEAVFRVFTDLEHGAARVSNIRKIELLTVGGLRLGTRWLETREVLGREDTAEMEITSYERNRTYTITHYKAGARIDAVFTACFFVWLQGRGAEYLLPRWLRPHAPLRLGLVYDLIPYLFPEAYLADATAVQLTRQPDAVARGLRALATRGGAIPGGGWAAPLFVIGPAAGPASGFKGDDFGFVSFSPPAPRRLARLRRQGATVDPLTELRVIGPVARVLLTAGVLLMGTAILGCALALTGIALAIAGHRKA